jgi:hypothetical protein
MVNNLTPELRAKLFPKKLRRTKDEPQWILLLINLKWWRTIELLGAFGCFVRELSDELEEAKPDGDHGDDRLGRIFNIIRKGFEEMVLMVNRTFSSVDKLSDWINLNGS